MLENESACAQLVVEKAECEMAAFLKSSMEIFGPGVVERAGELWIRVMDSREWADVRHERFFRSVSIIAAYQLSVALKPRTTATSIRNDEPRRNWQFALRSAH
jgi:hypothetical protein